MAKRYNEMVDRAAAKRQGATDRTLRSIQDLTLHLGLPDHKKVNDKTTLIVSTMKATIRMAGFVEPLTARADVESDALMGIPGELDRLVVSFQKVIDQFKEVYQKKVAAAEQVEAGKKIEAQTAEVSAAISSALPSTPQMQAIPGRGPGRPRGSAREKALGRTTLVPIGQPGPEEIPDEQPLTAPGEEGGGI